MKKAVKEQIKEYRPLEASLMTRFCPDHPGVMMNRVEDRVFQCSLDQKTYDFENGYTTLKGNKVPGSSVNNNHFDNNQQVSFSTREDLMKR